MKRVQREQSIVTETIKDVDKDLSLSTNEVNI